MPRPKFSLFSLVLLAATLGPAESLNAAEPVGEWDLYSDTWVATDALGRVQPGYADAGPVKPDKWVGIFYWTWHLPRGTGGPNDNTKLIAAAEDGVIAWPENGTPHHWGEPELGYYMMTDPFVIRKHASMLTDAGVDVVLFDTTNPPFTWKDEYEALCRVYTEMRAQGNRTPSIGFICPFGDPMPVLERVWLDLYKPGMWRDLWFRWEGKPFILANKDYVKDPAMLEFFTFRRPMPDYWKGPSGPDQWSWLEVHPQHVFRNSAGEAEQMSVGVAQNALPDTPGPAPMSHKRGAMGRSWHGGARDLREGSVHLGLNFAEQWRRVLEVDPSFVFVTGWNEWIAGRFQEWHIYSEEDSYFRKGMFVDQFDHEYSRDCEPMLGGHTDSYYYQLASWIRRYKGVRPTPEAAGPSAIVIDGDLSDWSDVVPEYRDTVGDVAHRKHRGYGDTVYLNATGRNDFVRMKTGYDADNLYFYAETAEAITPHTDPMWMLLLIDADQDGSTGWLGYDLVVNRSVGANGSGSVCRWEDGAWRTVGTARFRVAGDALELGVSRRLLGLEGAAPAFDFHWADNIQAYDGVEQLGLFGDSAPNRRWNYRYSTKNES
jgi:hypothetical protein